MGQEQKLPDSISLRVHDFTLRQVIQELETRYHINLYYSPSKLPLDRKITLVFDEAPLTTVLSEVCRQAGFEYRIKDDQVIFYSRNGDADKNVTTSGFVIDSITGERLIGAAVYFPELSMGTTTNEYGYYSISIPPGIYDINCSYIGYSTIHKIIVATSKQQISFALITEAYEIKPVLLEGSILNRAINLTPGTDVLPIKLMESYPALLGEKDVVQFLKMMPGVQTTTEGLNGLYVRGCLPQHTSFLIDDAPMFNMFHFSGWFSTLNPDAIKEVRLHKSMLPAKIGGSIASVAEISLRDGNNQHFNLTGGAGTITSRITVEGPIIRDRSSFIISFRRSYLDQLIRVSNPQKLIDMGKIYFYDLNAKINFTVNARNRLYISSYTGRDIFDDQGGAGWGNSLFSGRWNHLFSDKVFGNLTITGSGYDHYFDGQGDDDDYYKINIAIRNYNIKYDLTVYPAHNRKMNMGLNSRYILFPPVEFTGNSITMNPEAADRRTYKALLTTLYYQGDFKLTSDMNASLGMRLIWADKIYPDNVKTRIDPEPLISLEYTISDELSVKTGYSRNHQYYHGVSVFDLIIPFDKYVFWGNNLKPQVADHIIAGIYYSPVHRNLEFSMEPYFSMLKNQDRIQINEEIYFTRDKNINPVSGCLNVAGVDFSLRKTTGRITGFISYTLMKTHKKEEGVNHNAYFQTYYDRRHDLVVNMNYQLSRRIGFSSNWVYMSGNPYSLPVGKYELRGRSIPLYNSNSLYNRRMPDYHRLDVSVKIGFGKQNPCRHSLTLMVYNAYARKNAVFYHYSDITNGNIDNNPNNKNGDRLFSMMGYYFFNVFPAFSYDFKFGK